MLCVDAPSSDEHTVETKTVPQGSSIVMNCKTDLQQPVSYQWNKQGGILPHDVNTETVCNLSYTRVDKKIW